MKRVLHSVSIMDRGGQETLWMNVFRKIDRSKLVFDFLVTSSKKGDYDDEIESLGGKVIYVGDNPYKGRISKYFGEIKIIKEFFKKHSEYDTYHINTCHAFSTFFAVIGARLGGVPRVIVHSHNTNAVRPKLHKLFRPILGLLSFEAMACSYEAGVWMFGKRKMKTGDVIIVKNGIDTGIYKFDDNIRNKKRSELGIDDSTLLVGHIGRFNFQKNHTFLIDIFDEVTKLRPDSKLLLIGRGELEEEIKAKVEQKNLSDKVIFLGIRDDVNELLMAMDVFLFPSLFEGLSVVMVEAQATGINVVCSSSLTKDSFLNDNILSIDLDRPSAHWAKEIIEFAQTTRCVKQDKIILKGYDIIETSKMLQSFYFEG